MKKLFALLGRREREVNYTCDVCGREVFENERICKICYPVLPWNNGEICPLCGRKVWEAGVCLECKDKPLAVFKARSAFTHEGEAAKLVYRYKSGSRFLARTLAETIAPLAEREFPDADGYVPVPMTKKAKRRRGYNQSEDLCRELSRRTGKPVLIVAEKRRETAQQKALGRREREQNLEDCFSVTDRAAVKGKKLLIVDDIMTTGATASALASRLLRAGAKEAGLLTVASVQKKDPFGKPPKQ